MMLTKINPNADLLKNSNNHLLTDYHHLTNYLAQEKAFDVLTINIDKKAALTEQIIIASALSSTHLYALAYKVISFLKQQYQQKCLLDGYKGNRWIVIDANNLIIHLFMPDTRDHYNIEGHWDKLSQDIRHNNIS